MSAETQAAIAAANIAAAAHIAAAAVSSANQASATVAASANQANADRYAADKRAESDSDVAEIHKEGQVEVARISVSSDEAVAHIHADGQVAAVEAGKGGEVEVANAHAAGQIAVAEANARGEVAAAQIHADAQTGAAQIQADGQVAQAEADSDARREVATTQANATISASATEANARTAVGEADAAAARYKADKDYAGIVAREAGEDRRLQVRLDFASDKFDVVWPTVSGAIDTFGEDTSGGGNGNGIGFHASMRDTGLGGTVKSPMGFQSSPVMASQSYIGDAGGETQMGTYSHRTLGGGVVSPRMGAGDVYTGGIGFADSSTVASAVAATRLPFISTAGVLTPAQVQAQINQAYAHGDGKVATEIRKLTSDMVGRGFSSNSPILAALAVGLAGQNLRASLEAATRITLETAKLNADAQFQGQKAVSDQFLQQEQVMVDDAKNTVTRQVGVLNAVASLIGAAL